MVWSQVYNPLSNAWLSTLVAAVPIVVLLGALGIFRIKAHMAAIYGLIVSLLVATIIYGMPVSMAGTTAVFGAAFGLMPIGWIILNVIFLYQLTLEKGYFKVMQDSIAGVSQDRRLQLLLIAFCFGAFFEGASGFGTPVAVTGAILIGLGFSPLAASGLSLIANTAPVAYGALGTPIIALAAVTGLDLYDLSAMVGRQLPFFSLIVPFWLIWAFAGWRGMIEIWPATLVAGVGFADPAISDLELSRSLACRRSFIRGVDGLPDCLPQLLASAKDLDDDDSARPARRTCSQRRIAGSRIDRRRPRCAGSG